MRIETIIILLVLMFVVYVVITYRNLLSQNTTLHTLHLKIESQEDSHQNTDITRRNYNAIVRAYNHTLTSFIGKHIAHRLAYKQKDIIEKR